MKKITLITLTFFLCSVKSYSQWSDIDFSSKLSTLYDIYFINADTGFVTGFGGGPPDDTTKIYRTTNGGTTWTNVLQFNPVPFPGPSWSLHAFFFTSDTRGYCVGGRDGIYPFICSTMNGGITWDTVTLPYNIGIATNVFFPSTNVGYICGSRIIPNQTLLFKTSNGGSSWNNITANTTVMNGTPINDIHFLNDNLGFAGTEATASAQGGIYKTTDGGGSWSQVHALTNNDGIKALYFVDATNGFASATLGKVFKTTDGGNTWVPIPITQTQADVWDIYFFTPLVGYATGRDPSITLFTAIYKTTNGGTSWVVDHTAMGVISNVYYSLSFAGGKGYACGIGGYSKKNNAETGIGELVNESGINIFPNPATNELTIENGELKIKEIEIYSSLGEKVFSQPQTANHKQQTVDVSQLPPGIYFITVTDQAGNKVTKKVVKI